MALGGVALALAVLAPRAAASLRRVDALEHTHGVVRRSNVLPDLCRWARRTARADEAFVGDMVVTAQLRLCARVAVVSHPQYENAALRRRARLAYEFYGRREPAYLAALARSLRATYVLINKPHCTSRVGDGSRFVSLVDLDWEAQGNALAPSSLCDTAPAYADGAHAHFDVAHHNRDFWVLRVRAADERVPARGTPGVDFVARTLARDAEAGATLCEYAELLKQQGQQARAGDVLRMALDSNTADGSCLSREAQRLEAGQ